MSRRLRTTEVQRLLYQMGQHLARQQANGWVAVVDGKPLLVGGDSKDQDSRWGHAIRGYARGYKLHAVFGAGPVPLQWDVTPLNAAEPEVAAVLVGNLQGNGYLLGDKQYDSNPLHQVASGMGYQLVAERKRPNTALGHRPHSPSRLRSMELLQKDFGQALIHSREDVERQFGWLTNHAAGLAPLPNWVRRIWRVRSWVQAKILIHAAYVYFYRPPPPAS
jgi:hypothetical protein